MSSKCDRLSGAADSERQEERKEPESDLLEDLDEDSSGGESGAMSRATESTIGIAMCKEWTRGAGPACKERMCCKYCVQE